MPRLILFLAFPFLPGCLAFGYPSFTSTPDIPVRDPEVRAFKSFYRTGGMSMIMTGGESFNRSIEELPLNDHGVEAQKSSYFRYYVGGFPVAWYESRSWSVLLYRPGYEVIEVPSHGWVRGWFQRPLTQLAWTPAPDLATQVAALDKVCPTNWRAVKCSQVREFSAQEYERLARGPLANTQEQRDALLEKAARLRSEVSQ